MRLRLVPILACLVMIGCRNEDEKVHFTLSANGLLPDTVSYYVGTGSPAGSDFYVSEEITLPPFCLFHSHSEWGFGYGFTYCHTSDLKTPGFSNLSAVTGKGQCGDAYFTVRTDGVRYGHGSILTFQNGASYDAREVFVTNSVNAYLAMKNGDDGYGNLAFCKQDWGADDWLTLTITGYYDQYVTGFVKVSLAEGRNFVEDWKRVDLSPLGEVKSIGFLLESSDTTQMGVLNTPAFFCLDQLTVSEL